MDSSRPLHPNLARIAALYDQIYVRFANKSLTVDQATKEIAALRARDDEGTQWAIDPPTGAWQRRTRTGSWVNDTPPEYGIATPTPHDVSPSRVFNPDSQIDFIPVDDTLLHSPSALAGSTRIPYTPPPPPRGSWRARLRTLFRR